MELENKKGFKQTEVGLIPKDWVSLSVGEAVEENYIEKPIDGNHGNIHPKKSDFVVSGIPFIMANNVINGIVNTSTCSFISKKQADNLQKGFSYEGDVLLTHKGTVGNVAIVPKIDSDYIMLTPQVTYYRTTEKLNNKYLKGYFESNYFQKMLLTLSGGGTRAYIGIVKQKELSLVIPPTLAEQKAIASAVSDVDDLISSIDALIAKKKAIKQGAMQQLLTPPSKGGKRLDGFDGEWVEKSLGDIAEIATGTTPPTRNLDNYGDAFCFVSPADLGRGKFIAKTVKNLSAKGFSISRVFPQGSIMVTCIGSTIGKIGIAGKILTSNQQINAVFPNETFNSEFIYYQLSLITNQIKLMASEQAVPMINKSEFSEIIVFLPSLNEQKAIAQILSDMDKELEELATKKEKYEYIKQGMMQELLTGKTRLV